MTQWTSQQLKCLEAIGVPVYSHTPTEPQPAAVQQARPEAVASQPPTDALNEQQPAAQEPSSAASEKDEHSQQTATYYKLGPWVLEFSHTIPVESYDWLRDLSAYCQSTPVQVNATDKVVSIKKYDRNQLSPADKKALWRLLKANI